MKAIFPKQPNRPLDDLLSGEYNAVFDVGQFPQALGEFYGIGRDSPFSGMANPGGEFNVSDAITNAKRPSKRFVLGAVRRPTGNWIVQIEFGGRVHGYVVHFLDVSKSNVIPVWRCYLDQPALELKALISHVRNGSCKDGGL